MKTNFKYFFLLTVIVAIYTGCKRDDDYFVSTSSGFISNYDLRVIYKGNDLSLTPEAIDGATAIRGIVISDFRAGNSPAGVLVVQNSRIAGAAVDSLRGITFDIGASASNYVPGDSVHVKLEGATLKRVNGVLQIVGLSASAITKVASGRAVKLRQATTSEILQNPGRFESTLIAINNAAFDPEPVNGATYSGDKIINDGFGAATLRTDAGASFAGSKLLPSGNFTGIPFITGSGTSKKIEYRMRSLTDFFFVPMPKLSPAVISGFLVDPNGTDGNFEYVQLLATRDINFATSPMSLITNNNAGATTFPLAGWNTGGVRTYKFNLTSGTVKKGEYFYVGGAGQRINGSASTVIPSSKWITSINYTTVPGADGVGSAVANLLANSGNVAGIAVFEGTNTSVNSVPLDVIFFGGANGNFYTAGPPEAGYRITINDQYSSFAGTTAQEYYGKGTNIKRFAFPTATSFAKLGGVYKGTKGGWETFRSLTNVTLTNASVLSDIETGGTTSIDK